MNYGTEDDIRSWRWNGICVKGKIVIARYGEVLARGQGAAGPGAWRGGLH